MTKNWRTLMRRTVARYLSPIIAGALAIEAGHHPDHLEPHIERSPVGVHLNAPTGHGGIR
ncbi:hypothetical protein ACFQ1L_11815 [Phytohabitans flavus]|nr:hypothetical protein [Phytohabitans flavus]